MYIIDFNILLIPKIYLMNYFAPNRSQWKMLSLFYKASGIKAGSLKMLSVAKNVSLS
jgi:hypothetical protein